MRAFIAIAASLVVGCSATHPVRGDTDAEKLAVVREMLAAWHALDWEKVYSLFAEDGVLHSMMHEPVVGRDAIRERLGRLTPGISRIDLKVRTIGVVDGRVVVERIDDFVYKGHAGAVPVVGVLEVENGRIKLWREYYDYAQLLEEMGVSPAAGASHR
jgi:limonene-1,2-epoxide hydrolase